MIIIKSKRILFLVSICFFILMSLFCSFAEEKTIEIVPKIYEFDKNDYDFANMHEVNQIVSGEASLGKLSISGDISKDSTLMGGMDNLGVESGVINFSYNYNGALLNSNIEQWHLNSDDKKKITINNKSEKLEKIKKGAFILKVSYDKENWINAVNPVINFFEDNPKGRDNLYTTDGQQLSKGCHYRIIFLYELSKGIKKVPFFGFETGPKEYKRYAEVCEFYLCNNSGIISIHNLGANIATISEAEYSIEVLTAGETLLNESTTYEGFKIDKLGSTSYKVYVNDNEVEDGTKFTENGKYDIMVKTQLGKETHQIVYIFKDEKQGLSTYFNDSFVNGKRVYRDGELPTFDKNTKLTIKQTSDDVPYLRGTVINTDTNEILYEIDNSSREEWNQDLLPGSYQADLYNGIFESGSMYHYTFRFNIINEDAKPYKNFHNLMTREEIQDFETKHYEVVYQTTRGGYIYVCFPTYDEAFDYAYEIEKRFVEVKDDGVYYRSEANSNAKRRCQIDTDADKIKLTQRINEYARKNVEVAYFNPLEEFSYQTYANEDDLLKNLESLSIAESIKVFPSQEIKEKLFNKKPYINNFQFIKIADYDVNKIEMYDEDTMNKIDIDFNKNVNEQISNTGRYRVVETNKYGDTEEYDVTYVNSNTTMSKWNMISDGKNMVTDITCDNENTIFNVDYAILSQCANIQDERSLLKIVCKEAYDRDLTCTIDESKNICINKKGEYKIQFIDRNSNQYSIILKVKGQDINTIENMDKMKTIPELYNEMHINDKMEEKQDGITR